MSIGRWLGVEIRVHPGWLLVAALVVVSLAPWLSARAGGLPSETAVVVSLLPFHFPWREQLFISWCGLRGAVPIILALFPTLAGLEHSSTYFELVFFVVIPICGLLTLEAVRNLLEREPEVERAAHR